MQFKLLTVLAIAATASAQLSSLLQGAGDAVKSAINDEVQSLIPTVTHSGIIGDIASSARASFSNAVESKIGITASTTTTGTASAASTTSTGAANMNQAAEIGVAAALVAGFWGMAV